MGPLGALFAFFSPFVFIHISQYEVDSIRVESEKSTHSTFDVDTESERALLLQCCTLWSVRAVLPSSVL